MDGIIIVLGIGWLIYKFLKEEVFVKPVPPNTDYRQAFIDSCMGLSGKELDRRLTSGYYVKNEENEDK